jgi:hypothetical protein
MNTATLDHHVHLCAQTEDGDLLTQHLLADTNPYDLSNLALVAYLLEHYEIVRLINDTGETLHIYRRYEMRAHLAALIEQEMEETLKFPEGAHV